MIRPISSGMPSANQTGQNKSVSRQSSAGNANFNSSPPGQNSAADSVSNNTDVTSTTNDLESLISQLPSDIQDLFQGYLDTSVANDKEPNTLLTDLGTLEDSVNTAMEQSQADPNQPLDPNSLDVPNLLGDTSDSSAAGRVGSSVDSTGGSRSAVSNASGASAGTSDASVRSSISVGSVASGNQSARNYIGAASSGQAVGRRLNLHA